MVAARRLAAALVALTVLGPRDAVGHGFGDRYELPVPLELWLAGGGAAVALSFVVVARFRRRMPRTDYPRLNLLQFSPGRFFAHRSVLLLTRVVSILLLALVTLAAAIGSQDAVANLAPTFIWIVWWIGLAFVCALIGNAWAVLNPWDSIFRWTERGTGGGADEKALAARLRYPAWLGDWPAVVLFLIFAWAELVFDASATPVVLAIMIVVYSGVTWSGMCLFGRALWLSHCDPFARFFGLLARFSPTEVRVTDSNVCRACVLPCAGPDGDCVDCYECFRQASDAAREWNLRPFAVGLIRDPNASPSLISFVVLVLATVTYDGFMATPIWGDFHWALRAALPAGGARLVLVDTLGLLAFPVLFLATYTLFAGWVAAAAGEEHSREAVAGTFVLSLVPIAIGYHLAHYFTSLLVQGQQAIRLLSDPFGFGWNVLRTVGYAPVDIVGAMSAWYVAVGAIVAGHVLAVWVAHMVALRQFEKRGRAVRSQYPMLVLMVGYTMVSLWLIAQPIVYPSRY